MLYGILLANGKRIFICSYRIAASTIELEGATLIPVRNFPLNDNSNDIFYKQWVHLSGVAEITNSITVRLTGGFKLASGYTLLYGSINQKYHYTDNSRPDTSKDWFTLFLYKDNNLYIAEEYVKNGTNVSGSCIFSTSFVKTTTETFAYCRMNTSSTNLTWTKLSTSFAFTGTDGFTGSQSYVSGIANSLFSTKCLNISDGEFYPSDVTTVEKLAQVLFNVDNPNETAIQYDPFSETPDNPYEPGGDSGTGGGQGNFDDSSDPVPFSPLPSLSVTDSGFVGLFSPNISQLKNLANYLWNNDIDLDQLRKLVANPIDLLISLTIVPVTPEISGEQSIKVGFIDTGIIVNKLSNQFISVNFGKVDVKNFYDSAIDYSPFTKISIYLPYIGLRNLNVDEIMGTTIELQYNIDLFTGACVAEIMVGNAVMYSFNGNVATQIPLFSESFDSAFSALIGLVSTMGMADATSGASAAEGAASAGITRAQALSIGTSTLNAVMSAKPNVEHTGSMAGNIGFMGQKTPYLIYEIPRQSMPQYYQQYVGFPSNITAKLSDLSGFTVVSQIHLDNIPATTEELKEIESLLMGGVIL